MLEIRERAAWQEELLTGAGACIFARLQGGHYPITINYLHHHTISDPLSSPQAVVCPSRQQLNFNIFVHIIGRTQLPGPAVILYPPLLLF